MLDVNYSFKRYGFLGNEFLTWLWYITENDQKAVAEILGEPITLTLWREGQILSGRILAGKLGISVDRRPLPQALADWRQTQAYQLAGSRAARLAGSVVELDPSLLVAGVDARLTGSFEVDGVLAPQPAGRIKCSGRAVDRCRSASNTDWRCRSVRGLRPPSPP